MSDSGFTLREARPDEGEVIATLLTELGHPTRATEVPARLEALVAEGGAVLLAVDADGDVLGLMSLARHTSLHGGSVAYITALVTTAGARRRGVGRAFVEAAKAWGRRLGCARIAVTSAEHRTDAHAFYPACGLPYTGRRFSAMLDSPAH